MRATQRLTDVHRAYSAWCMLWTEIKFALQNSQVLRIDIRPDTRSLEQNDKFHALCEDLAKSHLEWQGKRRSKAQWKVLLVSGHAVATGEGAEMIPGLEGEFVNIRESTAQMSVKRSSSLIEYTQAFCAMQGLEMADAV